MNPPVLEWEWLDARQTVTVQELARACGLTPEELGDLVEYGALPAGDPQEGQRLFGAQWIMPLRTAGKLRADYDLDLFAVAMLLQYLARIDELERQLKSMSAHLPHLGNGDR